MAACMEGMGPRIQGGVACADRSSRIRINCSRIVGAQQRLEAEMRCRYMWELAGGIGWFRDISALQQ